MKQNFFTHKKINTWRMDEGLWQSFSFWGILIQNRMFSKRKHSLKWKSNHQNSQPLGQIVSILGCFQALWNFACSHRALCFEQVVRLEISLGWFQPDSFFNAMISWCKLRKSGILWQVILDNFKIIISNDQGRKYCSAKITYEHFSNAWFLI